MTACYLPSQQWLGHGIDLRLGRVNVDAVRLDLRPGGLDGARRLATRLVSAAALLDRLALPSAVDAWLDDPAAASALARQPDDRLESV